MKVELTKKEAAFIWQAAGIIEGVLDFENNNDKEFLEKYGFTKKEAYEIEKSLNRKFFIYKPEK